MCWRKKRFRDIAAFVAPAAAGVLLLGIYHYALFGSPFKTGYDSELRRNFNTPFYEGVYGMLFSGGKGMFFYSPALILFLFGFKEYLKRWAVGVWIAAGMTVATVGFYSSWTAWGGALAWGPRFIMPVLPLLAAGVGCFMETIAERRSWRFKVAVFFVILGLAAQFFPVAQSFGKESDVTEPSRIAGFGTQITHAEHALYSLTRWPGHIADMFRGGGSMSDVRIGGYVIGNVFGGAPDFWHSQLLYNRIPWLTAVTLACIVFLIGISVVSGKKAFRGFE